MHTTLRSPHRHTETKKFELIKWNEIWYARYLTVQFYELIFFLHVHPPKRPKIDCVQFAILSPQIYNVKNVCKTWSPQGEHFERIYVRIIYFMLPEESSWPQSYWVTRMSHDLLVVEVAPILKITSWHKSCVSSITAIFTIIFAFSFMLVLVNNSKFLVIFCQNSEIEP